MVLSWFARALQKPAIQSYFLSYRCLSFFGFVWTPPRRCAHKPLFGRVLVRSERGGKEGTQSSRLDFYGVADWFFFPFQQGGPQSGSCSHPPRSASSSRLHYVRQRVQLAHQ